jgi:DNA-binding response OmpR family regulator
MALLPEDGRMDRVVSAESILFESFRLDRRGGCLFRLDQGGAATPVALGSRALDLLWLLVERKGELVSKDAIMKAVWPGRVVEEANLNVQISKLRHILDQNRQRVRWDQRSRPMRRWLRCAWGGCSGESHFCAAAATA